MNRVVILQPSYLPWLGYFDQIAKADTFVFLDDVQYTKNDWRNRNKIKTSHGTSWLTIPVHAKHRISSHLRIKDISIADEHFYKNHLQIIQRYYKDAPYFTQIFPFVEKLLSYSTNFLSPLCIQQIKEISRFLGLNSVEFLTSSDILIEENDPTTRLVMMCKKLGATHYLTGAAAKSYLNEDIFQKNNITLEYQTFTHPIYPQLWGEFVSHLSCIDLLFNEGENSVNILKSI